ncbi:MAG TPA: hypothetical protein VNE39_21395 [Planctomycetota bacterium]|nr:hypothetical protein [Planctomycetota bacterium]
MPEESASFHRLMPLTAAQLEAASDPQAYRQAVRYAQSAHVVDRLRIGAALSARFHGTRGIYTTRIDVSGRAFQFECTCPLGGKREACKHVIALGLAWLDTPDTFHDLDVTLARLSHMTKGDLITLLRQAAQRLPELIALLDRPRRE